LANPHNVPVLLLVLVVLLLLLPLL